MPRTPTVERVRRDLCPGVLRPWPADDGALVRIRLIGGLLRATELEALAGVSAAYGDGDLHLTGRANLQLRGLPAADGRLPEDLVSAIEHTGLLPSRTHELVRNVMASPLTGISGGRADLRPVLQQLDRHLCADPALATLPGRFLFVLDDGRGDLAERSTDLGAVVLDENTAQLRLGSSAWGPVVDLAELAPRLAALALDFVRVRGDGPDAPWHVDELPGGRLGPLAGSALADPLALVSSGPAPFGPLEGAEHVPVPDGVLGPEQVARLLDRAGAGDLVVTPWHGVLVVGAGR